MSLCLPGDIKACGTSGQLHIWGIIGQVGSFKRIGFLVHTWPKGWTTSWCVPIPSVFFHLCNFLHWIYSPVIQALGYSEKCFLSLRKEPYVFWYCSVFFSGDFIAQVTYQWLGSFLGRSESFIIPWFTEMKILSGIFLKIIFWLSSVGRWIRYTGWRVCFHSCREAVIHSIANTS